MNKFDGILLLSDMDGTLTHNEKLSDENAEAIKYFCDNGGYFTVATGRQPNHIKKYVPQMVLNAPVIALNGTVIYDIYKDKLLYKNFLSQNAKEAAEYVYKNFSKIEAICANMLSGSLEWNSSLAIPPLFDFKNNEIMKILFISSDKEFILDLKNILSEKYPEFVFLRSWENGLEMLPKYCGKGECIKLLKKHLPIKTVISAGDYENDISMIEMSDIGCAAKNSAPLLLKKADYISCDCQEHIIADIIKQLENGFLNLNF